MTGKPTSILKIDLERAENDLKTIAHLEYEGAYLRGNNIHWNSEEAKQMTHKSIARIFTYWREAYTLRILLKARAEALQSYRDYRLCRGVTKHQAKEALLHYCVLNKIAHTNE